MKEKKCIECAYCGNEEDVFFCNWLSDGRGHMIVLEDEEACDDFQECD